MLGPLIAWTVKAVVVFGALAALGLVRGEAWPAVVAAIGFSLTMLVGIRRYQRISRALTDPIRPAIEECLRTHISLFRGLDEAERGRFLRQVQYLVDTLTFETVPGVTFDEPTRVLAVAGAAMLVRGRPDYRFAKTRSVLLYPDHFSHEYDIGADHNIAGMVHHQGPIIFSKRALQKGWRRDDDAYNVSIHEWAHVLDLDDGFADGVPGFAKDLERWNEVMDRELERARSRRDTALDPYAGTDRAETFAVATECFFEKPRALRRKNPELYELLVSAFNLDPCESDDG
ncbi:MAG: M90 family metallopeptidase [Polyangiales bacterium]